MRCWGRLLCWLAGRLRFGLIGLLGLRGDTKLNHRGHRGAQSRRPYFPYSFLITSPPFITNFTRSRVETSFRGSPSTATISAHAPGSKVPTLPDHPSRSAAFAVAA